MLFISHMFLTISNRCILKDLLKFKQKNFDKWKGNSKLLD